MQAGRPHRKLTESAFFSILFSSLVALHESAEMYTQLHMGLELNVHGLPKWMKKMNPDKMNSADRHHLVSFLLAHHRLLAAPVRKLLRETCPRFQLACGPDGAAHGEGLMCSKSA